MLIDSSKIGLGAMLLLLFQASLTLANRPIIFSEKHQVLEIRTPIQILEDRTGKRTIQEIITSHQFSLSKHAVPNLGVSSSAFWLKFEIINKTDAENILLELAHPLIDEVCLYTIYSTGKIDSITIGERQPFSQRKYPYRNYLFDLKIPQSKTQIYFLKVVSGDQLLVPLSIGTYQAISESHVQRDLISGIYFGIVIVMLLYNLFIYFTVKDKSYLFYVIYIFFVGLTQATLQGYGFNYLWPNIPWLAVQSVFLTGALSGIATIFFAKSFLQTKKHTPKLDLVLNVYLCIYIVCIILSIIGYYNLSYILIDLNAGPGSLFLLYAAYKIYFKKKYIPAKFFLLAWSVFLISVSIFVMKDYGLLPYNVFTYYGLQIGSAVEVLLLSFALADRINILKREKEESQARTLAALHENERITRERNKMLDTEVQERTQELRDSYKELSATLNRLKEAQAQLVNAEKMASVGQLTAGIAHEINNPINFVSAAIRPLKRNIGYFMEVLNTYENTSNQPDVIDLFKEVEALKKKYDLDYLKEEVDIILQGIEDGASRTTEIVRGLRNFSRLDEAELKLANVSIGLDSTIVLLQGTINGRITIRKDYEDLPDVECYAGKLNQVFMNILTNSIQAIQAKGLPPGEGCITVQTRHTEKALIIRFTDNGIGMSETVKNRMFEPFYTTKSVGEGTGLGMSIVYSIIQMHEGTITVESEPGAGADITLTIPKTYTGAEKQITH